MSSDS